jgi:hypothetical protein
MSKTTKVVLSVCLVAFVGACAKKEAAPVYMDPEPITIESTYTGKYK